MTNLLFRIWRSISDLSWSRIWEVRARKLLILFLKAFIFFHILFFIVPQDKRKTSASEADPDGQLYNTHADLIWEHCNPYVRSILSRPITFDPAWSRVLGKSYIKDIWYMNTNTRNVSSKKVHTLHSAFQTFFKVDDIIGIPYKRVFGVFLSSFS